MRTQESLSRSSSSSWQPLSEERWMGAECARSGRGGEGAGGALAKRIGRHSAKAV